MTKLNILLNYIKKKDAGSEATTIYLSLTRQSLLKSKRKLAKRTSINQHYLTL